MITWKNDDTGDSLLDKLADMVAFHRPVVLRIGKIQTSTSRSGLCCHPQHDVIETTAPGCLQKVEAHPSPPRRQKFLAGAAGRGLPDAPAGRWLCSLCYG